MDANVAGIDADRAQVDGRWCTSDSAVTARVDSLGGTFGYGEAVSYCRATSEGVLIVDNGEYANTVAYCPFCGVKGAPQCSIATTSCGRADGHEGECSRLDA